MSDTRAFSSHHLAPSGRGHPSPPCSLARTPTTCHAPPLPPPIQRGRAGLKERERRRKSTPARHSPFCSPPPRQSAPPAPHPGRLHGRLPPDPRTYPLAFPAPPDRSGQGLSAVPAARCPRRARGTACVIPVAGRLKEGGPEWPRHRCCLCCCNPARRARALDQRQLSPRSLPTNSHQERNRTLTSQWTSNSFHPASSGFGSSCPASSPFSRRLALKSQASTIPCGSNPPLSLRHPSPHSSLAA